MARPYSTQPIDARAKHGEDKRDCRSSRSSIYTICQVYCRGALCFDGLLDVTTVADEIGCVTSCTQGW